MARQRAQNFQAFFFAVFFDLVSEDCLVSRLMHAWFKAESAAVLRLLNGPSGKDFGYFGDVFLRVSAVYAERVKLQQLAAIVFVQAAGDLCFPLGRPILRLPIAALLVASRRDPQSNL